MPEPSFIIKVCGVKRQADVDVTCEAGANAIGFNFYPKSWRYIDPRAAGELQTPSSCLRVGVFVNADVDLVQHVAQTARLDVIQLHGRRLALAENLTIWRSLPAGSPTPTEDPRIAGYLMDAPTPHHGGSGQVFDWSLAREFPFPLIVAGGLDASNVADAIEAVRPWGVDACSRLESSRGEKDHAKIRAFATAARIASEKILRQEVVTP